MPAAEPHLPMTTAFLAGGYAGTCPTCGNPAQQDPRYPNALCVPCTDSAVCRDHQLPAALGGDGSPLSGGFLPGHISPAGNWEPCTAHGLDRYTLVVLVHSQPCLMEEARFGGTVVQPAD
jgi:hypothetical protein